jgi:hypothetical protein
MAGSCGNDLCGYRETFFKGGGGWNDELGGGANKTESRRARVPDFIRQMRIFVFKNAVNVSSILT